MKVHAVRIDLSHAGLELVVNPGEPGVTNGSRARFPSQWLSRMDGVAAINATPFVPEVIFPGQSVSLNGLAVSGGEIWSVKAHNLDAWVQEWDGGWRFLRHADRPGQARIGFGGFLQTLSGGVNVGEQAPCDAATVVGLSADRHWMYWLVVDGGQPGYSEGATPRETAGMLRDLGASDALNLDGGSSSTLVVNDGWLGPRVCNRPRHPALAGLQRPVGNVLVMRRKRAP